MEIVKGLGLALVGFLIGVSISKLMEDDTPKGYDRDEVNRLLDSIYTSYEDSISVLNDSIKAVESRIDTIIIEKTKVDIRYEKVFERIDTADWDELDSLIFMGTSKYRN